MKRRSTILRRLASLWPMWLIMITSLAVREYYPLSRFPMYSHFDKQTHYLFFTDENGAPVSDMLHQFGQTSNRLHKMHTTKVQKLRSRPGGGKRDDLELMRAVSPELIEQMLDFQRKRWMRIKKQDEKRDFERLDLWVEYLRYEDGDDGKGTYIAREALLLGTWPPEDAGTPPPVESPASPGFWPDSASQSAPQTPEVKP